MPAFLHLISAFYSQVASKSFSLETGTLTVQAGMSTSPARFIVSTTPAFQNGGHSDGPTQTELPRDFSKRWRFSNKPLFALGGQFHGKLSRGTTQTLAKDLS